MFDVATMMSLDQETTAKVFIAIAGAEGLLMNVAPKFTCDMYGLKDSTDVTQYLVKQCGTGILSYAVMTYCLFFQKTSMYTAFQATNAVWIYEQLRNILNGDAIKGGAASTNGIKFALATNVFNVFAMTQDYADTVFKANSIFWGLSGLQIFLAPESGAETWQFDSRKLDATAKMLWRLFGCFLLALSAFMGSISFFEATNLQAMGYGSIAWGLWHAAGHLRGDFKQLGIHVAPRLFWLLFHATMIGLTLF
jgi:hypothetical protein